MAGMGFGFGSVRSGVVPISMGTMPAVQELSPGSRWDGTAGSGFDGNAPLDPERETAKPALQLLTPPNQVFTQELTVGVFAAANDRGSLLNNLGLRAVVFHFEGNSVEINTPGLHTFADANGKAVTYLGFWTVIKAPPGTGSFNEAHLYAEAMPADPAMQNRVIGPFTFLPSDRLHDAEITFAMDDGSADFVGADCVKNALAFLKSQNAQNPLLTAVQSGNYDLNGGSPTHTGKGYLTIEAADGVVATFAKSGYTGDVGARIRTRYEVLHLKGSGIVLDKRFISHLYDEASGRHHWLDGISVTDSGASGDGTSYTLWRGGLPPVASLTRSGCYMTECNVQNINDPCRGNILNRGNIVAHCYKDVASGALCSVGNSFENMNNEFLWAELDALTLQYTGSASTATIEMDGGNGKNERVITLKEDGVTVATFTVLTTEAAWEADTNYTLANVVTWIDGQAGWSATLEDDSRRAAWLSTPGNRGAAFGPTDAKTAALTLVTTMDAHADFYAQDNVPENVVIAGNVGWDLYTQGFALSYNGPDPVDTRDYVIVNNAFHNLVSSNPDHGSQDCQLNRPQSHVVVAHNSYATQDLLLRADDEYDPDRFCLVANNSFARIVWAGGSAADPDMKVTGNHTHAGSTAPDGSEDHTIGGDATSLFIDAGNGDFTPTGALLDNTKSPAARYGWSHAVRDASSPAGAFG